MTIEEKARAYDKAIEKIKYVMEHGVSPTLNKEDLESLFPELAESEDERIRKEIIRVLKGEISFTSEKENEKYIAWLEKQGDKDKLIQELGEYKVKYTQEVLEKHLKTINKDDERLRKTTISFLKDFADKGYENAVECIDWLEKQGEQKPVPAWSEEDKEALEVAIIALEDMYSEDSPLDCYAGHHMPFDKAANQLKSIKDRVQPQPKQEWSEEDEELLQHCCGAVAAADYYTLEDKEEMENWLKSLKKKWRNYDKNI